MVNIFGLNVFLAASSLFAIGLIVTIVVGVFAAGAAVGTTVGVRHKRKSKKAKLLKNQAENTIDLSKVNKSINTLETTNAQKDQLEQERLNQLLNKDTVVEDSKKEDTAETQQDKKKDDINIDMSNFDELLNKSLTQNKDSLDETILGE